MLSIACGQLGRRVGAGLALVLAALLGIGLALSLVAVTQGVGAALAAPADSYFVHVPTHIQPFRPCLSAPHQISPTNGTQLDGLVPEFTFLRGTYPVTLTFVLYSEDPTFQSPSSRGIGLGFTSPGPRSIRVLENLEEATTYYWRATDICASTSSPPSPVYSFTTGAGGTLPLGPALLSPANETQGLAPPFSLGWEMVPDAILYGVTRCAGQCLEFSTSFTSLASSFLLLQPNTTYTWYVRALNHYGYGEPSPVWSFRTGSFAVGAHAATAPVLASSWPYAFVLDAPLGRLALPQP